MTRIIAGAAGSITLDVPGQGTRPTSDRVRESLFGALESADALRGARVVDLYAGSGALGLEAASRGASSADLVERSPAATVIAKRNAARVAKSLGTAAVLRVHTASVIAFLKDAASRATGDCFDLALIDPPYDVGEAELTEALMLLLPLLAASATVIIERAARSPEPSLPAGLAITRSRRYGDTMLWWAALG